VCFPHSPFPTTFSLARNDCSFSHFFEPLYIHLLNAPLVVFPISLFFFFFFTALAFPFPAGRRNVVQVELKNLFNSQHLFSGSAFFSFLFSFNQAYPQGVRRGNFRKSCPLPVPDLHFAQRPSWEHKSPCLVMVDTPPTRQQPCPLLYHTSFWTPPSL